MQSHSPLSRCNRRLRSLSFRGACVFTVNGGLGSFWPVRLRQEIVDEVNAPHTEQRECLVKVTELAVRLKDRGLPAAATPFKPWPASGAALISQTAQAATFRGGK